MPDMRGDCPVYQLPLAAITKEGIDVAAIKHNAHMLCAYIVHYSI